MSSRRKKTQKIDMSDISKPILNNKQQFSQESASRAYTSHLRESKGRYNDTFLQIFGFTLEDFSSWNKFVSLLFKPMDPASLGVVRALFGVLMVLDVVEERGLANADIKWGDPNECRFPLFDVLKPLPLDWMCIIHLIMWAGAFGIMLGFFFNWSCVAFIAPYWYIVLLDKSSWNNHSYLYGLISILLLGTDANRFWSIDGLFGRVRSNSHVPLWNYMVLRFQFFILYFFAGLKKMDRDWIEGHSLSNLSSHWVFEPFKLLLSPEQVDYWIIHQFGFLLDLTISFWLFFDKTRPYALIFCTSFHLMNSRIFSIGMFPYVCLAMQPIFCHFDWPRHVIALFHFKRQVKTFPVDSIQENELCIYPERDHLKSIDSKIS